VKIGARILMVGSIAVAIIGIGAWAQSLVEQSANAPATAQTTATGAAIGGPFTLVGADGKTVTDQGFRGKWMLVYFGYTFCPDVCPTTLTNMAQALVQLHSTANAVAPLFITIDPARDTPQVIGDYVKAFDPRIVGLTGSATQIARVAQEYHIYYAKQPGGGKDYLVDHSSFVYLMTPQGRFAKVMPGSLGAGAMADAIRSFIGSTS
jgi:protein SCO1/2